MPPENELWLICPVCKHPNPAGREFCQKCWGATLNSVKPVSTREKDEILEQWYSQLKRKKKIKLITIGIISLIALISATFLGLYCFTDLILTPPQNVNSNPIAGEWSMFRHDLNHSGSSDSSNSSPQGTVKWVFSTEGPIHSSPAVVDGVVYIGSRDGKLYALDTATGTKLWEYETDSWVDSSPAVANGVVYFGSNDGNLYALDAHSGEKLWEFKAGQGVTSSPAVADGIVYIGARNHKLHAVDTTTGKELWSYDTNGFVTSSPAVADGIVYVGSNDGSFYALHAQSGRFRLYYKTYDPIISSPAVSDETVYFTNSDGALYAIDGKARNWPWEYDFRPFWIQAWAFGLPVPTPPLPSGFLWALNLGISSSSSPLLANDTLYVGVGNKLLTVDLQSHEKRWEFEAEDAITSSPALANNILYAGSEDGRLYAVNVTTGEKLWDITTGGKITSSPAVADATIYIGSHDGNIYAIE
jgi:outer membrane protein assembly factor BamB